MPYEPTLTHRVAGQMGDRSLALAAYHRGPTRLSRQLRSGTTIRSRYADEVLALYRELGSSS